MNWKQKLIVLAVPATLAVAGGSLIAAHAATPGATPSTPKATQPAEPATEPADTTTEPATEPTTPEPSGNGQSGHADPAGQVDHQFDGQE